MSRLSWKTPLLILAVATVPLCNAQDTDRDGIRDSTERALLSTYRPYYRFSHDHGSGETFRPTDVRAYLAASEIDGTGSEGSNVLLSTRRCARTTSRSSASTSAIAVRQI